MRVSRRALLAGAVSAVATRAWADAPLTSIRPIARVPNKDAVALMVANADLAGEVGVVVVDTASGEVIEAISADTPQPPASVTKTITAPYALEALGSEYRFKTRLFASGIIQNGILDGNLILAGGGDPNLVTDDLAQLAQRLKDMGLRAVKGDFEVWDSALVNLDEIDSQQLDYLGYNPTITGLNLNFNRVHFEWKRIEDAFETAMDARSENYRPVVTSSRIRIVDRANPVFTYRTAGNVDQWTVAKAALNDEGSRWLPVRNPALYAGQVFATFARSHGIVLKTPQETAEEPSGTPLAEIESPPLPELMRSMLRYSTNITAEAAGLMATSVRTGQQRGLRTSAYGMARWADDRAGGIAPYLVDHSGLGDLSRITAADMVQFLLAPDVEDTLRPIMRVVPLVGEDDKVIAGGAEVRAKTGTLNFVSALAGYVKTQQGRNLAFAIFASDLEARERGKLQGDERPPGARSWNRRARTLQQDILKHLAVRLV
ncbi:D-alanyl-D-alanine carboxypeptidase/D-alanyl-D-alanine endopeptidase [Loktanella sp. Alg231-35]|uniref:D-alanyl-D-alanine carboxypeptidase/D-alanyl-D-alanine endopeptidase n=1 Tax=Loktanella sp. Alg231-35 TaxID=1922220 RepID=UPI001F46164C|nr:D-alanyl-D-alanine carboxypeptidase/D-alanyl-D-alanine-endopeptidase [Loktanella sp. Alg231-35]